MGPTYTLSFLPFATMEKVLFLDFDGVLNGPAPYVKAPKWARERHPFIWVNDYLVGRLARVFETVKDASIVVSSTWRKTFEVAELQRILNEECPGLGRLVIGRTPVFQHAVRGVEIQSWLTNNPHVRRYVIVDDDSDMLPSQEPFFVQTEFSSGLTEANVARIIAHLK